MHQQISPEYIVAKQQAFDTDREELRAFVNSPEFSQLETTQQGFIISQAGLMATLSEVMSIRLGASDNISIVPSDGVHPARLVKVDQASSVLYPAIKAALVELGQLPPGFNDVVDKAYNILWDAFWSETPASRDVPQRREG